MVRVYPIAPQSQFKKNSRATVPLKDGLYNLQIVYSVLFHIVISETQFCKLKEILESNKLELQNSSDVNCKVSATVQYVNNFKFYFNAFTEEQ